jgi:thioredoxin-dependent peroxiredoxin
VAQTAKRCEQFGQEYGVWLKEWRLLQQAVFVIGRHDCIAYAEYVADQLREPDYAEALYAMQQAAMEGHRGGKGA